MIDHAIRIRADIKGSRRGWTKFLGQKIYSEWVDASGWVEIDLRVGFSHGKFFAYTRSGYVRSGSSNWLTDYVLNVMDTEVRAQVANHVNQGVQSAVGGNLNRWLHRQIANAIPGINSSQIHEAMEMSRVSVRARPNGLEIAIPASRSHTPQSMNSLTGTYDSAKGVLDLVQTQTRVHGTVAYPNGNRGQLSGIIVGNRIEFQWHNRADHGTGSFSIQQGGRVLFGGGSDQNRKHFSWTLYRR